MPIGSRSLRSPSRRSHSHRRPTPPQAAPLSPPSRRKRWRGWAAGLGLVGGLALAHAIAGGLTPRFEAEALIEREPRGGDFTVEQRLAATRTFRAAVLDDVPRAALDGLAVVPVERALRQRAERLLAMASGRLAGPSAADGPAVASAGAVEPSALHLDARISPDGGVLSVTTAATTAEAARVLATTVAERLVAERQRRRREGLAVRLAATETALEDTRRAIDHAERALADLAVEAPDEARSALAALAARARSAEARRSMLAADLAELEAAAVPPLDLERLLDRPRSQDLADAVAAQERAAARVLALQETYGDRHPVMKAAVAARAGRDRDVRRAAEALVASARAELDAQKAVVERLEHERTAQAAMVAEREAARRSAEQRRARLGEARDRAATLAATRAQLRATLATLAPDARVVLVSDPARVHDHRTLAALYGAGGLGGLVAGGLLGRVGRTGAGRIAGVAEAEALTGLPVLARLPRPPRPGQRNAAFDAAIERMALRLGAAAQPSRALAIARLDGSAGIAATAVTLGEALTRDQLAVLVVEATGTRADGPGRGRNAAAANPQTVCHGDAAWSEAVRALTARGPWLLTAPRHGGTEASAGALEPVLAEAVRRFDRIVVSAPPLTTPAGLRVARAVGAVVLVIGRARTTPDELVRGLQEVVAVGGRPVGLVLIE